MTKVYNTRLYWKCVFRKVNKSFFLLLELLHANAKFWQINWRIERTKTRGSIFFSKNKILQR